MTLIPFTWCPRIWQWSKKIERTETGQTVRLSGRLETDGRVTDAEGQYIQYDQKEGRKLILIERYELMPTTNPPPRAR
ncbi:MAG: hypothetical protein IGS03_10440 [Candidatus Sericytochromatia bacterium]|nr:hypothetical protein [Candidatus Sericytochromatia bacterium]